jgi:hypothetical protein
MGVHASNPSWQDSEVGGSQSKASPQAKVEDSI